MRRGTFMRLRWAQWAPVLAGLAAASLAAAFDAQVTSNDRLLQTCSGMWAGTDTSVTLSLTAAESDAKVAVIVYEWADFPRLGARMRMVNMDLGDGHRVNSRAATQYICTPEAVNRELCPPDQVGNWIAPDNGTFARRIMIASPQNTSAPFRYEVAKTGYYCVGATSVSRADGDPGAVEADGSAPFSGIVHFQNKFEGTMPAAEHPKMAFYSWLTVAYALLATGWGYLCFKYRDELLPIQYMISGILVFLVMDMAVQSGYLNYQNKHSIDYFHMRALLPGHAGVTVGLRVFFAVTTLLDAARTTLSLFLLLVVSLGYGVVRPSLGPVMRRVQVLAVVHFLCGVLYTVGVIMLITESSVAWPLVMILPLAMALAVFLVWILHALTTTIATLEQRRQTFKQRVFISLHRLLWGTALAMMILFVVIGVFMGQIGGEFGPGTWKYRWFFLDGWLSLLYLGAFVGVAYLWRPTGQNLRLSMSDEVATDDVGAPDNYEINEFAHADGPDDEERRADQAQGGQADGSGFYEGVLPTLQRIEETGTRTPAQPTAAAPASAVVYDTSTAFSIGEDDVDALSKSETRQTEQAKSKHKGSDAEQQALFDSSDNSLSDVGQDEDVKKING